MQSVSSNFLTAANNMFRHAVSKVDIYFHGEGQAATTFEGSDIISFTLLEEVAAQSDNPLGSVSSNELSLVLLNNNHKFTATNTSSPFYGLLVPNVKVVLYIGLEVSEDVYEYIPRGTFWTGDWKSPTDSMETSVVCYDRLYNIRQMIVPQIAVQKNVSVIGYLTALFTSLGLSGSDYNIDSSLTQTIPYGWYTGNNVGEILQELVYFAGCFIYMTRDNKIRVKNLFNVGTSVATLTDSNQIMKINIPTEYLKTYASVEIESKTPCITDIQQLVVLEQVSVPVGLTTIDRLSLGDNITARVQAINIIGASNCIVQDVKYGASDISFTINNTGVQTEIADIYVFGHIVQNLTKLNSAVNINLQNAIGYKPLKVDSVLFQDSALAATACTNLLKIVQSPGSYVEMDFRVHPAVELGDTITVQSVIDSIPAMEVVVLHIGTNFDGALDGNISCIKKAVLI